MKKLLKKYKGEIVCGAILYASFAILVLFGVIPRVYGDSNDGLVSGLIFLFVQIPAKIVGMLVGTIIMMVLFVVVLLFGMDINSPEVVEGSYTMIFGPANIIEHSIVNVFLLVFVIFVCVLVKRICKRLFTNNYACIYAS